MRAPYKNFEELEQLLPIKGLNSEVLSSALKTDRSSKSECTKRSSVSTVCGSIPASGGELLVGAGTLYAHRVNVGSCEEAKSLSTTKPLSMTVADQFQLHSNAAHHPALQMCQDPEPDRNANTIFRTRTFTPTDSICRKLDLTDIRKHSALGSSVSTTSSSAENDGDGTSSVDEETVILKV